MSADILQIDAEGTTPSRARPLPRRATCPATRRLPATRSPLAALRSAPRAPVPAA